MSEVAAIGGESILLPFRAMGVKVFPAQDSREAEELLRDLVSREPPFAVILVTEDLARNIMQGIREMARGGGVAISFIPGSGGSLGLGRERMRALVRRAIGTDL